MKIEEPPWKSRWLDILTTKSCAQKLTNNRSKLFKTHYTQNILWIHQLNTIYFHFKWFPKHVLFPLCMSLRYLRKISNTWAAEQQKADDSFHQPSQFPFYSAGHNIHGSSNKLQLFYLHRSLGIEKAKTYLRFFILIGSSSFASSAASCSSLTVTDFSKTLDFILMKIFKLMSETSCTNQGQHVQQLWSDKGRHVGSQSLSE